MKEYDHNIRQHIEYSDILQWVGYLFIMLFLLIFWLELERELHSPEQEYKMHQTVPTNQGPIL